MPKIKIVDLPQNKKVSKEEMKSVFGGLALSSSFRSPLLTAVKRPAIGIGSQDSGYCDCWSYTAGNIGNIGGLYQR